MFDPKPYGAFLEYTLKPLLDDSREFVELLEEKGVKLTDIAKLSWKLFLVDKLVSLVQSVLVTGMICLTLWICLIYIY